MHARDAAHRSRRRLPHAPNQRHERAVLGHSLRTLPHVPRPRLPAIAPLRRSLAGRARGAKRRCELRAANALRKKTVDIADAYRGAGLVKKVLFVSHRWEMQGAPDGTWAPDVLAYVLADERHDLYAYAKAGVAPGQS